jgi:hypothetical protein
MLLSGRTDRVKEYLHSDFLTVPVIDGTCALMKTGFVGIAVDAYLLPLQSSSTDLKSS